MGSLNYLIVSVSCLNPCFFVELPLGQLHFALLLTSVGAPRAVLRAGERGHPQRRAGLMETIEKVEFYPVNHLCSNYPDPSLTGIALHSPPDRGSWRACRHGGQEKACRFWALWAAGLPFIEDGSTWNEVSLNLYNHRDLELN